jgi:hypothetical protein
VPCPRKQHSSMAVSYDISDSQVVSMIIISYMMSC